MGLIDDVDRLQKQIDAKRQEADHIAVTIRDYQMRNEPDQARAEESKLSQINNEITNLTAQLKSKQSEADNLQQQLKRAESNMSNARQILNEVRSRETHIVNEIDHLNTNIRTLQSSLGGGGSIF